MDFIYKYRRLMVIILASILIGLGLFQEFTKIELNRNVVSGVEYVVLFGALYLLFILPKNYKAKEDKDAEDQVEEQIDMKIDKEE